MNNVGIFLYKQNSIIVHYALFIVHFFKKMPGSGSSGIFHMIALLLYLNIDAE
jgi:hypothetical protein